jgi:hypothetical protein
MRLKTYDITVSPEKLRGNVVYTLAQCESHKLTVQFVPIFTNLLAEWQAVFGQYLSLLDMVTRAESRVDGCDDEIDIFVDNVSATLLLIYNNDRGSDEYKQYFGSEQPYVVKKPILDDELERVRGWIRMLKGSSHPLLKELSARCEALVKSADEAVAALATANEEYRIFRLTGEYSKFVDNFNATRKSAHGEISKLPHQAEGKNLPVDFADGFFRHEKRRRKKVTIDSVQKEMAALYGQLEILKATLEDLQSKEAEQKKEEAAQAALLAQYQEAEKNRREAEKAAGALREKLRM